MESLEYLNPVTGGGNATWVLLEEQVHNIYLLIDSLRQDTTQGVFKMEDHCVLLWNCFRFQPSSSSACSHRSKKEKLAFWHYTGIWGWECYCKVSMHWMSICSGLPGAVQIEAHCRIIIDNVRIYSQKCPSLDDQLYDHPSEGVNKSSLWHALRNNSPPWFNQDSEPTDQRNSILEYWKPCLFQL